MIQPTELAPLPAQQGMLGQIEVTGTGYGIRDVATRRMLLEADPTLAEREISIVEILGVEQFPGVALDPAFNPGQDLRVVPDPVHAGAAGVFDVTGTKQIGWLPADAATAAIARSNAGRPVLARSLWAWRSGDGALRSLRVALAPYELELAGAATAAPAATPQRPVADTETGRFGIVLVGALIVVALVGAIIWQAVSGRESSNPEPSPSEAPVTVITTTTAPVTTVPTTVPPDTGVPGG